MSLSHDELSILKQKRREAALRAAAIFASLTAAAMMVFFLFRLVQGRMVNDRKARESVESERQHFEKRAPAVRTMRDEPPALFGVASRATPSEGDVVDMSAPGSAARANRPAPADATSVESPSSSGGQPPAAAIDSTGIEKLEQKLPAIAEVLRKFFEARSVADMVPVVRDVPHVRPLMEEFYDRSRIKRRTWKGIGEAIPVGEPGHRLAYVQATFTDAPPIYVVVEETGSGFLVDWESSVQYSEMGWRMFLTTRPVQPKLFRVIASKVETGEGGALLSLRHPQEAGEVIGRFDPADPNFRTLVEQLDLCKWKDVPVILRLCYLGPDANANEVRIAGVVGKGWLILGDRASGS